MWDVEAAEVDMLGVNRMGEIGNRCAALAVLACACNGMAYLAARVPNLLSITIVTDREANVTRATLPQDARPILRAKTTAPLSLTQKRVQCTLEPSSEEPAEKAPTVPAVVKSLDPSRKLYLVVGDLRTNVQPGVLYSLYLDLPHGASPRIAEAHFAGQINFFNARVAEDPKKAAKSPQFVSLPVTELARTLVSQGKLKDRPVVTVIPDGEPVAAAKPLIGEIKLVEQ